MSIPRRHLLRSLALAASLSPITPLLRAHDRDEGDEDDDAGFRSGKVFTMSNAGAGNELLVFDAERLRPLGRMATGGLGSGGGLGNQGAVTLSEDGRHLFVVNAGSHTVSTFRLRQARIELISTVDSGGLQPVSVTEDHGVVVVLNAGGAGNVAGFRNRRGRLAPIAGAMQPLSAAGGTAPAQVGFAEQGRVLVVTEKATNRITSYAVRPDGSIGAPVVTASAGPTPFGFAVDRAGTLLVSEAAGGAPGASTLSSYAFDAHRGATPRLISGAVPSGQTAACWVVVTPGGRFAYVTNTGNNTVSSYAVGRHGQATLLQAVATATDGGPIDAALSPRGRQLFVLNGSGRTVQSFAVGSDGSLAASQRVNGLPAASNGLAAN